MGNYKLKIEKIDNDNFIINKNKNFNYLLKSSNALHQKILDDKKNEYQSKFGKESPEFVDLIIELMNDDPIALVNAVHLIEMRRWIDVLCVITLQKDQVNFKDKNIIKFFKIAEIFNQQITQYIPNTK